MQKAQGDIQYAASSPNDSGLVIHEDGSAVQSVRDSSISASTTLNPNDDDDDASTRAIASPPSANGSIHRNVNGSGSLDAVPSIPTIRISTDSGVDEGEDAEKSSVNGHATPSSALDHDTLEKPVQAAAGDNVDQAGEMPVTANQDAFSFSNKRLCERWLDNLFMVLYEASRFCGSCPRGLTTVANRTCGFGLYSALRLRISRHSMSHTGKLGTNGKSLATLVCVCITKRRPRKLTNDALIPHDTPRNHGQN